MSIQGNVNSIIGMIAGAKKFHNYELQQKANTEMKQQQLAIQRQKQMTQEYMAKTKRKELNLKAKMYREKSQDDGVYLAGQKVTDKGLINKIKELQKDGK